MDSAKLLEILVDYLILQKKRTKFLNVQDADALEYFASVVLAPFLNFLIPSGKHKMLR